MIPAKVYTGTFVPAAICMDPALNPAEKLLLGYMTSFKQRFFASDAHVGQKLGMAEKSVANLMSRLRKKGYLEGRNVKKHFPNQGTEFPNQGTRLPELGNIDKRVEQSREEREKIVTLPKPDLLGSAADRTVLVLGLSGLGLGFGEEALRRELDALVMEVRHGHTPEPRNWSMYLRRRMGMMAAKKAAPYYEKPPVSQFSKVYR